MEAPLSKLVCVMVGLPARGKTYIARKVARYLTWLGHRSRIFNVGNYRRQKVGAAQPSHFFDPENSEFARQREELADEALADMLTWLNLGGEDGSLEGIVAHDSSSSINEKYNFLTLDNGAPTVKSPSRPGGQGVGGTSCIALYDATNSTKKRRLMIENRCRENGFAVMFIESLCDDEDIIMHNILEVKLSSPDYIDVTEEEAVKDFKLRINQYEKSYQELDFAEMNGTYP